MNESFRSVNLSQNFSVPEESFLSFSPTITNMVSKFSVGCELKLDVIAMKLHKVEYNPVRFSAAVLKLISPRITALIFRTGVIILTGARSENDSYLGARIITKLLLKLGFPTTLLHFKIVNMTGKTNLKFPIRLEGLAENNEQAVQYDPELFPALFYRIFKPKLALLIFVNGQIGITGAQSRDQMKEALSKIYPILRQYRKMK